MFCSVGSSERFQIKILMFQPGCLEVGPDEKQGFLGLSSGFFGSINFSSSITKSFRAIDLILLVLNDKLLF